MKLKALLLVGFIAGYTLPAFGDCDHKRSALSDFGVAALGDRGDRLPREVKPLPNCEIYEGKYVDCELIDISGVSYLLFENVINRKDIVIHRGQRPAPLPFGLKSTDKIADVVKKITPRNDAPDFYVRYQDGKLELFSNACVINRSGEEFIID